MQPSQNGITIHIQALGSRYVLIVARSKVSAGSVHSTLADAVSKAQRIADTWGTK